MNVEYIIEGKLPSYLTDEKAILMIGVEGTYLKRTALDKVIVEGDPKKIQSLLTLAELITKCKLVRNS